MNLTANSIPSSEKLIQDFSSQFSPNMQLKDLEKLGNIFQRKIEAINQAKEEISAVEQKINQGLLGCKKGRRTVTLLTSLSIIGWFFSVLSAIEQTTSSAQQNNKGWDIAGPILGLISATLSGVTAVSWYIYKKNKQKEEEILTFNEEEIEHLKEFVTFIKAVKNVPNESSQESIKTCMKRYKELTYSELLPSQEKWVSLMIHLLPETHPFKQKVLEFYREATKLSSFTETPPSPIASSSEELISIDQKVSDLVDQMSIEEINILQSKWKEITEEIELEDLQYLEIEGKKISSKGVIQESTEKTNHLPSTFSKDPESLLATTS